MNSMFYWESFYSPSIYFTVLELYMQKIRNVILYLILLVPSVLGGALVRRWGLRFFLNNLGKNVGIEDNVQLIDPSNISIGSDSNIGSLSCLCANGSGKLLIGQRLACNRNVFINAASGNINIGSDVMIGPNTVLRASDHAFVRQDIPMRSQGHVQGFITIEDDVWLGSNVVVTSNVTIGRGTIVAAGAVVTRNLEAFSIYGGVPAKLIRRRK